MEERVVRGVEEEGDQRGWESHDKHHHQLVVEALICLQMALCTAILPCTPASASQLCTATLQNNNNNKAHHTHIYTHLHLHTYLCDCPADGVSSC